MSGGGLLLLSEVRPKLSGDNLPGWQQSDMNMKSDLTPSYPRRGAGGGPEGREPPPGAQRQGGRSPGPSNRLASIGRHARFIVLRPPVHCLLGMMFLYLMFLLNVGFGAVSTALPSVCEFQWTAGFSDPYDGFLGSAYFSNELSPSKAKYSDWPLK